MINSISSFSSIFVTIWNTDGIIFKAGVLNIFINEHYINVIRISKSHFNGNKDLKMWERERD